VVCPYGKCAKSSVYIYVHKYFSLAICMYFLCIYVFFMYLCISYVFQFSYMHDA